jgi:hypothetical protein
VTALLNDLGTDAPRLVLVAPTTGLRHSVEIRRVVHEPLSIPPEVAILAAAEEAMVVVISVTETEIATVTFETTAMDPRFAEIWIVTGLAATEIAIATSIPEITGSALAEVDQGPQHAIFEM